MKEIKLTQGRVTLVDDEDYEYLNQWKWFCMISMNTKGGNAYAARNIMINGKAQIIMMHNVILSEIPEGLFCDHKDRDGLNNQRSNLRLCNRSQNMANRGKWGSQKYKGVVRRRKGFFEVRIAKQLVGVYLDEKIAALKYNEAALKKYGEFAVLNVITE